MLIFRQMAKPKQNGLKPFGTKLPAPLIHRLKVAAAKRELKVQQVIESLVQKWCSAMEEK